jgi:ABC-type dipeptide/oligopeptide/nickel transport system ATPase component
MLFITHNLGVVACVADSVLVMDRGELCETGAVSRVLEHPAHEYTRRLLDAAPTMPDPDLDGVAS